MRYKWNVSLKKSCPKSPRKDLRLLFLTEEKSIKRQYFSTSFIALSKWWSSIIETYKSHKSIPYRWSVWNGIDLWDLYGFQDSIQLFYKSLSQRLRVLVVIKVRFNIKYIYFVSQIVLLYYILHQTTIKKKDIYSREFTNHDDS